MKFQLKKLPGDPRLASTSAVALADGALGHAHASEPVQYSASQRECFHTLYREHFDFVFRNLRRLGVAESGIDDALQDVYMIVLRRIDTLDPGSHVKAWLFAILLRVARNHRRSHRRRARPEPIREDSYPTDQPDPFDLAARAEAARVIDAFLSELDESRRAVFVMAELEQMTAPEIAEALSANVNTVYSWLRGARLRFVDKLASLRRPGEADG